jgi:PPIC-type PPIASE domain
MRTVLREPLLHFLLLGLALFALFNAVSGARGGVDRRIVISDGTVALLVQRHQATWQRPPTASELQGLIDTYVREEMLYREGVAMGLQRDDPVVRRRVLQRVDVITEEAQSRAAPSDGELQAYLDAHAERYARPAVIGFDQVLFDPLRHGKQIDARLAAALARLHAGAAPDTLGDSSLLPSSTPAMAADLVARDYGDEFAKAVLALPAGAGWQGPVRSGYGLHLVRVTSKTAPRASVLAEVRAALERDWDNERRQRAVDTYVRDLRKTYDVVVQAALGSKGQP